MKKILLLLLICVNMYSIGLKTNGCMCNTNGVWSYSLETFKIKFDNDYDSSTYNSIVIIGKGLYNIINVSNMLETKKIGEIFMITYSGIDIQNCKCNAVVYIENGKLVGLKLLYTDREIYYK